MPARIVHSQSLNEYWFHEGCHILEVSNHADDPDVSIARARVEAGKKTRLHKLNAVTERYLIFAGEGMVEIDRREGVRVTAGDVVVIPANSPQCIENTGTADLVFYAICSPRFTPDCYQELE